MSVRDTTILKSKELKFLLNDSLELYTSNSHYIDGENPYRFSINKKEFYILIKNVHESGNGRGNQDESRLQISRSQKFKEVLSSKKPVIPLGYFQDDKVFTGWNPFYMRDRYNNKANISIYTRFSVQKEASISGISNYMDNNGNSVITFKPQYLGLYLENYEQIHYLDKNELLNLIEVSDKSNNDNSFEDVNFGKNKLTITHERFKRNPKFIKEVKEAYNHRCAMCGIQLECVDAAHIIPISDDLGIDEVENGICLCTLHHRAYDRGILFFDEDFKIKYNDEKINYLTKMKLDSGIHKLNSLTFEKIELPNNAMFYPNKRNIKIANSKRLIN